jgi:RNA polymerase sigma-70 factor, ECF subfamily
MHTQAPGLHDLPGLRIASIHFGQQGGQHADSEHTHFLQYIRYPVEAMDITVASTLTPLPQSGVLMLFSEHVSNWQTTTASGMSGRRFLPATEVLSAKLIDRDELVAVLPRLRRYARVLTGDRTRADDLVQDAVERALARESTFHAGANLRAWLFSLMHNLFIDGTRQREAIDWSADTSELPEMAAVRQSDPAEMRDIQSALVKLPQEQREVLLLVAVEGLRYREAADVLAVPVGTVMSRLARAREKMQELLGGVSVGAGKGEAG